MSNQEMQFADPDWQPAQPGQPSPAYTPQPVNASGSERIQQPVVETPPAQEEVYGGYAGAQPEKIYQPPSSQYRQMPYRRRRHRAWFWIILAIILFSLMGGGVGSLGSIGQRSITESFPVPALAAGTPAIVINDTSGNIQVHAGNSLSIQEVKKSGFFDDPNNIQVKENESGSTITLNVVTGGGFLSSESVDFNITVPANVNLSLTTNSGDISVANASGSMALTTSSGNITTENDVFAGYANLTTTSGDIHSTNDTFNADATLSTTSGDISMKQDTLNGSATVHNTSGNIDFSGTLASSNPSNPSYQFTTGSGDINVSLAPDANVAVQAQTNSGSINADDFPSVNVQDQGPGSQASGSVGSPSGATLTLSTNSGDITFHMQR